MYLVLFGKCTKPSPQAAPQAPQALALPAPSCGAGKRIVTDCSIIIPRPTAGFFFSILIKARCKRHSKKLLLKLIYCLPGRADMTRMLADDSRAEALQYLEFWLSSIYLHTQGESGARCAPILLAGTHKDRVPGRTEHEAISSAIRGRFAAAAASTAWPAVVEYDEGGLCFFPVDNTRGHSDPAVPAALRTVEELAGQADHTRLEVPFAWLRCYDAMRRQGNKVLSLAEAVAIAGGCGLPVSGRLGLEEETLLLLGFFQRLGRLMHFLEPFLRDFVVLRSFEFLIAPANLVTATTASTRRRRTGGRARWRGSGRCSRARPSCAGGCSMRCGWTPRRAPRRSAC